MSTPDDVSRRTAIGMMAAAAAAVRAGATSDAKAEEPAMEKVQGIGGFFFRAKDPDKLAKWYEDHLGVMRVPSNYGGKAWHTEAGTTVFAPFKESTTYFGDMRLQWMLNFRVGNLDRMAAQLRAAGIAVEIDPETYPNGRFAKLNDPEGNPIQLWQPEDGG
jgi:predicted enzyme related to lactoylglutathione lyase